VEVKLSVTETFWMIFNIT